MAKAPAPSASISANGSFWAPSRTRPLEPTQIAPDFSTTGSNAAASPPVMGSLALPRATRFETTTRFTGPLLVARAINGYSSIWFPVTLSTNWNQIQAATRGTRRNRYKKSLCAQLHAATGQKHFRIQRRGNDLVGIMVAPQFCHRSDARATRGRRWVGRNGRPRPAHAGPRKTRARQD